MLAHPNILDFLTYKHLPGFWMSRHVKTFPESEIYLQVFQNTHILESLISQSYFRFFANPDPPAIMDFSECQQIL